MPIISTARKVLEIEADALLSACVRLDEKFSRAVQLILDRCPPGKVVVMGVGKSGHIGRKIAATLASTGTPAFFVHPTEAGHGDLGVITQRDVVIAISYSGTNDDLLRIIPYFKRNSIAMIAITASEKSLLAANADVWIDGSVDQEACPLGLAPTASTALGLALGDALAVCLLKQRGITQEDFATTHPHGALGRRLLVTVGDIMLSGADIPKASPDSTIRNCLTEISRGGIGMVGIVTPNGFLSGIFTDVDLRRALDQNVDIYLTPVSSAMTTAPRSVRAHQLAAEAAEVMERHKIIALPVTDAEGRLVGAFNTRILLRSGVI